MPLPNVSIEVLSNALGRVATVDDTVVAMVLSGPAATGLAQNVAARVFSVAGAEALGITAALSSHAYTQISDFFALAGTDAELWIMLVPDTTTAAAICAANGPLQRLIAASAGRVTLATFSMKRAGGWNPGSLYFDYDVAAVGALAQTIANGFFLVNAPVRIVLEGSYLNSTKFDAGDAFPNFRAIGDRVAIFCGAANAGDRHACMGRLMGWMAAFSVETHPGRTKSGAFLGQGYLTTGVAIEKYVLSQLSALNDAAIMALRYHIGLGGAYITDDPSFSLVTSDFSSFTRGRVIDKAVRLTYTTYVGELNSTIDIEDDGKLKATQVAYLCSIIETSLRENMTAEGNISDASCFINPNQNVLATDRVEVQLNIRPRGYQKYIKVKLGFENPANQ